MSFQPPPWPTIRSCVSAAGERSRRFWPLAAGPQTPFCGPFSSQSKPSRELDGPRNDPLFTTGQQDVCLPKASTTFCAPLSEVGFTPNPRPKRASKEQQRKSRTIKKDKRQTKMRREPEADPNRRNQGLRARSIYHGDIREIREISEITAGCVIYEK